MKKTIATLALIIISTAAQAQTCLFDNMRGTYRVVTNEQDTVAIAAQGSSGTVYRAEWLAGDTNEAALRASGDVKSTNYTDAVAAGKMNTNAAHSSLSGIDGAGTLHVTAADTNKIATAWQNPASSTNWTWTSDGTAITLTGYSGPAAVVIPDTLDNLPVTGFGTIFTGVAITSISGGLNIKSIPANAFFGCTALTSITFPSVTWIGDSSCGNCSSLTSISMPLLAAISYGAFYGCSSLTSISFPSVTGIDTEALAGCTALMSVLFGQNAPVEVGDDEYGGTPNVTNYVTSPTATGWGATWNGRPVVRLPVYADTFTGGGTGITNVPLAGVSGLNDALAAKVSTNGMTDAIHGARSGLNLHALADGSGAGFLSAMDFTAIGSMKNRTNAFEMAVAHTNRTDNPHAVTPAQIGAISNTPAGIAAAGGMVTNGSASGLSGCPSGAATIAQVASNTAALLWRSGTLRIASSSEAASYTPYSSTILFDGNNTGYAYWDTDQLPSGITNVNVRFSWVASSVQTNSTTVGFRIGTAFANTDGKFLDVNTGSLFTTIPATSTNLYTSSVSIPITPGYTNASACYVVRLGGSDSNTNVVKGISLFYSFAN